MRNINNATRGNTNKMLTLYIYVLRTETMYNVVVLQLALMYKKTDVKWVFVVIKRTYGDQEIISANHTL